MSGKTASFERERKCLEVLQGLEHPNIVDLLCAYTYRKEHSLVFKCEDINLNEFLALPHRYGDFVSDTVFFTVRALSVLLTNFSSFVTDTVMKHLSLLECLCLGSVLEDLIEMNLGMALFEGPE